MKRILSTLTLGAALASDAVPAAQDDEELKKAAAELEARLTDLRAELEGMRARLAEETKSGPGTAEMKRSLEQRTAEERARRFEVRDRKGETRKRIVEIRAELRAHVMSAPVARAASGPPGVLEAQRASAPARPVAPAPRRSTR